ncbi:MAG: hypothetical protein ACK4P4_09190 [Allorhizobium sp.]
MTCFIELGHASTAGFPAMGPKPVALVSGAFGVKLDGSFDVMLVSSSEDGWLHVSRGPHTDKAAIGKSRRIIAGQQRSLSGVGGGMYVSFIADSQVDVFDKHEQ